jgi:hypothetical protein
MNIKTDRGFSAVCGCYYNGVLSLKYAGSPKFVSPNACAAKWGIKTFSTL